jgi:hypothetical protein
MPQIPGMTLVKGDTLGHLESCTASLKVEHVLLMRNAATRFSHCVKEASIILSYLILCLPY